MFCFVDVCVGSKVVRKEEIERQGKKSFKEAGVGDQSKLCQARAFHTARYVHVLARARIQRPPVPCTTRALGVCDGSIWLGGEVHGHDIGRAVATSSTLTTQAVYQAFSWLSCIDAASLVLVDEKGMKKSDARAVTPFLIPDASESGQE